MAIFQLDQQWVHVHADHVMQGTCQCAWGALHEMHGLHQVYKVRLPTHLFVPQDQVPAGSGIIKGC